MPQPPSAPKSRQKGTMLTSTACLLAIIAFFAGLLLGSLVPHGQGSPDVAPVSQTPVSQTPAPDIHIAQAREQAARTPGDAAAWIHLGNLYFDAHNAPEAITAYERALQLKPGDHNVMTDLGTMYRLARQPQKALALYDQVLAADPGHQNARFNKGVTLIIDLARPADGLAAWRDLLARNPHAVIGNNTPLSEALAPLLTDAGQQLQQQGQREAALEAYEEALRIDPNFPPALKARSALLDQDAPDGPSRAGMPPDTSSLPPQNTPGRP